MIKRLKSIKKSMEKLTNYCESSGGPDSHKAGLLCLKRLIGEKQLCDIDITSNTKLDII